MALRRALAWAGLQTGVRIALAFASAKVSAIYLGPAGMALVGQLGGFIQVMQGALANGANTAVVNLTAEHRDKPAALRSLWATSLRLVLALASLLVLAVLFLAPPIAGWLLSDATYWPAVAVAGAVVLFAVADAIFGGVLNGLKRIDLIAKAAIASSVLEVALFAALAYRFGIWGGLVGAGLLYVVRFCFTCGAAFGSKAVTLSDFRSPFDPDIARQIAHFYPMLLAQSIAFPLGQILVRNDVIGALGLEQTGFLQATWRLSDMYVGVFTIALGMYFMSHFSSLDSEEARGKMLRRTIAQVTGLTAVAAVTIYLLRDVIIELVLSPKFMPMEKILPYHLLGDVFKMAGYPMQMALAAQRRSGIYIAVAAGMPIAFVLLTHVLLPSRGMQAAPMAYSASYLGLLVVLLLASRKPLIPARRVSES